MTYTVSSGTLNSTIPYHTIVPPLKYTVFEIFNFKNVATLKSESKVTQGHWYWHVSIRHPWLPINVP